MAKNYWNIDCAHCGQSLRLTVENKNLGRTVEAICPKCKKQTPTTIGVPVVDEQVSDIPPELKEKVEALADTITEDSEICDLIQSIREDGYDVFFAIGLYGHHQRKKTAVTPKVGKDGKIEVGTFTQEDEEAFRKAFKIKL